MPLSGGGTGRVTYNITPVLGFTGAGDFCVLVMVVQLAHILYEDLPRKALAVCPTANHVAVFAGFPLVCVVVWSVWPVAQCAFDRIIPVFEGDGIPAVGLAFYSDFTVFGCLAGLHVINIVDELVYLNYSCHLCLLCFVPGAFPPPGL